MIKTADLFDLDSVIRAIAVRKSSISLIKAVVSGTASPTRIGKCKHNLKNRFYENLNDLNQLKIYRAAYKEIIKKRSN